jgi:hypothetical protein
MLPDAAVGEGNAAVGLGAFEHARTSALGARK